MFYPSAWSMLCNLRTLMAKAGGLKIASLRNRVKHCLRTSDKNKTKVNQMSTLLGEKLSGRGLAPFPPMQTRSWVPFPTP